MSWEAGGGGGGMMTMVAVACCDCFVAAGCVRPGGGVANPSVGRAVVAVKRGADDGDYGRQGRR